MDNTTAVKHIDRSEDIEHHLAHFQLSWPLVYEDVVQISIAKRHHDAVLHVL
eukprot:CAMPEP_0171966858 /NCGR_PEP_ID=MMETSP0993-20121228/194786_1 /TAXON_ID=483369 /ORGANISM="non described non described, Strain CCMP2098" /LENGTH=51 /DNA_ID=CAMNT_0012616221 /DNA_START=35 /DNA_END=187 /DNA_ORIENTATION=+